MPATVDALLPLSLLEAVRRVDTPEAYQDVEFVGDLRNKRFGVSDTVYAQIRRYTEAVQREERLPLSDAAAIARLIGRRSDAEQVFRSAGRYLAGEVYRRIPKFSRWVARVLPSFIARPVALRATRRVAARYYNGTIERVGAFVVLDVSESVTASAASGAIGCTYYEASLAEILARLVHTGGVVDHVRCVRRGEGICQWRAEWRPRR
jgi:predicted hydrocarbon binding protein